MPRHSHILTALAALTVFVTPGASAQQKRDDSFHWTGVIAAGKTLRIQDVNGSIKATGTSSKMRRVGSAPVEKVTPRAWRSAWNRTAT
jgi:hypothetical protein